MAVPSSGPLHLWDDIWNQEIGGTQGENSLHSASVYAGFSTPDAMSDFYGWADVELPGVTTSNANSTTASSMRLNGSITSTGNQAVLRGFYHGTNANSYSSNTKYTVGGTQANTGTFLLDRTGLNYNTTYYFWAWASNDAGETVASRLQSKTNVPSFSASLVRMKCGRGKANRNGEIYGGRTQAGYLNPYTQAINPINSAGVFSDLFSCYDQGNNTPTDNSFQYARNAVSYVSFCGYGDYGPSCYFVCVGSQGGINPWNADNNVPGVPNGLWKTSCTSYGAAQGIVINLNTTDRICANTYRNCSFGRGTPSRTYAYFSECYTPSDIRLKTNINYL